MPKPRSARDVAVLVLGRWRKNPGRLEPLLKEALAKSPFDQRDRALAMELVYGAARNLINLDFVLSHFVKEPPKGVSPEIRDILRVAAYQIMHLDRVPARAAVYEAVRQSKVVEPGAGGFVNAVLRALLRGLGSVAYPGKAEDPAGFLSIRYSFPRWLSMRWVSRFGPAEAEALMKAMNGVPPVTLRVNTLKIDRAGLTELLVRAGVNCTPTAYAPDGLTVKGYPLIAELPGYAEGLFAVQDEAAQLVSILLTPRSGERVLDACAAPGGKTGHLAQISGGKAAITAMDIGLDKLRLLKENINRLGLVSVAAVAGDAAGPLPVKGPFDKILLDAPCSALGVIRRRPEIKYSRTEDDIARLSGLQARMLENLAGLVRPGGVLVYSVCSTEPEEGELAVEKFLKASEAFKVDGPAPFLPEAARGLVTAEGFLRTYPHRHGTDGFFAARICRNR